MGRQGRRIKHRRSASRTTPLIALGVLAAVLVGASWWLLHRPAPTPPLSASERTAGIHRLTPTGTGAPDPVGIGADNQMVNVWVTDISGGQAAIQVSTPLGNEQVRLGVGQQASPLGVGLHVVRIKQQAYADVRIVAPPS